MTGTQLHTAHNTKQNRIVYRKIDTDVKVESKFSVSRAALRDRHYLDTYHYELMGNWRDIASDELGNWPDTTQTILVTIIQKRRHVVSNMYIRRCLI